MTKEQLLEIGLSEEQIKEVFRLNGIAVENAKKDYSELQKKLELKESEVEKLEDQIKTANEQIEEFKNIDVNELESKIDEYKQKYKEAESKYTAELEELKFNYELENQLRTYNPYDVADIMIHINKDDLKVTDKGILGIEEQVKDLKENKPYLFKDNAEGKEDKNKFKGMNPLDPNNKRTSGGNDGTLTYDEMLMLAEQGLLE